MVKDMIIADLVKRYPDSVQILSKHGIPCVGCCVATWETVQQCAESYEADVEKLTQELGKIVTNKNFEVVIQNRAKNSM